MKISCTLVSKKVGDDYIVYSDEYDNDTRMVMFKVNETGKIILDFLQAEQTISQVFTSALRVFSGDEVLIKDSIKAFLLSLNNDGILYLDENEKKLIEDY